MMEKFDKAKCEEKISFYETALTPLKVKVETYHFLENHFGEIFATSIMNLESLLIAPHSYYLQKGELRNAHMLRKEMDVVLESLNHIVTNYIINNPEKFQNYIDMYLDTTPEQMNGFKA